MVAYRTPSNIKSAVQLTSAFAAFVLANIAMYESLCVSYWLTLGLVLDTAGLVLRLFSIQHDCGHRAFFRNRHLNDFVGSCCGVVTLTPYWNFRYHHAKHHAVSNNLDGRIASNDIFSRCMTLAEYQDRSPSWRMLYRAIHHPIVFQVLLPPCIFLVLHRLPLATPAFRRRERASVHLTNLLIAGVWLSQVWLLGFQAFVLVQLPLLLVASVAGAWLLSVQHRFEQSQWSRRENWHRVEAALTGSSFLKMHWLLHWFTGNVGFHHVHHLDPSIPNYWLQSVHEMYCGLWDHVPVLTLRQAFLAPGYALWDEDARRMIRFPPIGLRGPLISRSDIEHYHE